MRRTRIQKTLIQKTRIQKSPAREKKVNWQELAERRVTRILKKVKEFPTLVKAAQSGKRVDWTVDVLITTSARMKRLNATYRGKDYATDVLSFPTQAPFRELGCLGELILCLPVLKAQAKSMGHSPEMELDVLMVHGVLHLLGFDHEQGPKETRIMARWERKVLASLYPKRASQIQFGLIGRLG